VWCGVVVWWLPEKIRDEMRIWPLQSADRRLPDMQVGWQKRATQSSLQICATPASDDSYVLNCLQKLCFERQRRCFHARSSFCRHVRGKVRHEPLWLLRPAPPEEPAPVGWKKPPTPRMLSSLSITMLQPAISRVFASHTRL
jgi:hypothetical protein